MAVSDFSHASDHLPVVVSMLLPDHFIEERAADQVRPIEESFQLTRWALDDVKLENFRSSLNRTVFRAEHDPSDLFSQLLNAILTEGRKCGLLRIMKGHRGRPHGGQPWFNGECRVARYRARNLYRKMRRKGYPPPLLNAYANLKSIYRRTLVNHREVYYRSVSTAINNSRNPADFWKAVRRSKRSAFLEDPISLHSWQLFYREMYSRGMEATEVLIDLPLYEVSELDRPFTAGEVRNGLKHLRSGRASGEDGVPNEVLKALPDNCIDVIVDIFNKCLSLGEVPSSWSTILLRMLYKKGDRMLPESYRGIALVNTTPKLFTHLLAVRIKTWGESRGIFPESQAGFRVGRSCADQNFILYAVSAYFRIKKKQSLVCVMVDLSRAFDSLKHSLLWSKLAKLGLSSRILAFLRSLYGKARFKLSKRESPESFEQDITQGVLQGDSLSPLLFILFMADLEDFMASKGCSGVRVGEHEFMLLSFADDVAILADSVPDAQEKMNAFLEYCQLNFLTVNIKKSKVLVFGHRKKIEKYKKIRCGEEGLEYVFDFTYLGVTFSSSGKFRTNLERKVSKAKSATGCLRGFCVNGKISSWDSKRTLFRALVESVLLYSAEVWGLWYGDSLEPVQSQFLKSLLCLPRSTPNHFLRVETGYPALKVLAYERAIKYWAKISRMGESRWPRICFGILANMHKSSNGLNDYNWYTELFSLLSTLGSEEYFAVEDPQTIKRALPSILEKLRNHFWSKDIEYVFNARYNSFFRRIVDYSGRQAYLGLVQNVQVERVLCQLRLASERFVTFYYKGNSYKFVSENICNICNLREPDTLYHFCLRCPILEPYRGHYISEYMKGPHSVSDEDRMASLLDFGGDKQKAMNIFEFVSRSLTLRAFSLSE